MTIIIGCVISSWSQFLRLLISLCLLMCFKMLTKDLGRSRERVADRIVY
jgi:hypothetical protein